VGSFLLPLVLYLLKAPVIVGWAKPVPFRPVKLRQYPRDQVFVALAGPLSNFALAYICFTLYVISGSVLNGRFAGSAVAFHLALFAPITLEGLPWANLWFVFLEFLDLGILINLALGVFNLIPFPPLDGSWILKSLLPKKWLPIYGKVRVFGFLLLVVALQLGFLGLIFYPAGILFALMHQLGSLCLR
jgi:Zn-dependent protease